MRRVAHILFFAALLAFIPKAKAQTLVNRTITMWTTGQHLLWDSTTVRYYGFADGFLTPPQFPGPTIIVNEGDSVHLNVRNQSQGAYHTVHLHGLDVDQYNDGVPHTSWHIEHMEMKTYKFKAKHAGTFLYHCHVASIVHVQMGMYGNIIVKAANGINTAWTGGPAYDRTYNWLMSEFDRSWHDNIPVHSMGNDSVFDEIAVPAYNPDYFFVNGKSHDGLQDTTIAINGYTGESIYLRLSNMGYLSNKVVFPGGVTATVIDSDGRPLPQSFVSDTVEVGPGERYGVMLSATQPVTGQISVGYYDMFNDTLSATEYVPITLLNPIALDPWEKFSAEIKVFPNPAHGSVRIHLGENYSQASSGSQTGTWQISLRDLSGRELLSQAHNFGTSGDAEISLSDLTPGVLLINLQNGQQQLNRKVVVMP